MRECLGSPGSCKHSELMRKQPLVAPVVLLELDGVRYRMTEFDRFVLRNP